MKTTQCFSEKHPRLNLLFSLILLLAMIVGSCILIHTMLSWLFDITEKAFIFSKLYQPLLTLLLLLL